MNDYKSGVAYAKFCKWAERWRNFQALDKEGFSTTSAIERAENEMVVALSDFEEACKEPEEEDDVRAPEPPRYLGPAVTITLEDDEDPDSSEEP